MKKKNIFPIAAIAVMLLAVGCGKDAAKEALADQTEIIETQEISGGYEDSEESSQEENSIVELTTVEKEEEVIVEGSNGVIRIGTTGVPYTELLTQAKLQLAKKGWDVQVEVYSDYEKINQDVLNGSLDAHLFAHQTYMDSYNDVNGTELTTAARISYEKYGIYSILNEDLTNIKADVTVGIPEDGTRQARALLFLQDTGYITLKENVGLTAIMDDIVDNPKNIKFVTYAQETAEEILQTTDYCIMGADQAILAGLEPHKEVLKEETASFNSAQSMAALLVTTAENAGSEGVRLLEDAIKSEETCKYVEDTYKGALGLFP